MKALFDFSFRSYVTRRLAGVFYIIGLVLIALAALLFFFSWIVTAFSVIGYAPGQGLLLLLGAIILMPLGALVSVIALRVSIETVVAIIAVAENTRQTAENTNAR